MESIPMGQPPMMPPMESPMMYPPMMSMGSSSMSASRIVMLILLVCCILGSIGAAVYYHYLYGKVETQLKQESDLLDQIMNIKLTTPTPTKKKK